MTATQIAALLIEREGYVRRKLAHRVAAVDEQLAALGVTQVETTTAVPGAERAAMPKARRRRK